MTDPEDEHARRTVAALLGEPYVEAAWVAIEAERRLEVRASSTSTGFLFDLASITKPFTASVALWCVSRGMLELHEQVFPDRLANAPSLDDLLRHLGGAIAWWPLYLDAEATGIPPLQPKHWPGVRGIYSDVGYLTAARWIEQRTQRSLLDLLGAFVQEELPMLCFQAAPFPILRMVEENIALDDCRPSPCTTGKEVELASGLALELEDLGPPNLGEPQDGNARWLARRGIFAGHAGLLGTTRAVEALLARWLRAVHGPGETSLGPRSPSLNQLFLDALEPREGRLLGWQRPPEEWQQPPTMFGHFGFTGGMVWADTRVRSSMVLLAHRTACDADLSPSRRALTRSWRQWARAAEERPELPRSAC